jgi:hypothetical protein
MTQKIKKIIITLVLLCPLFLAAPALADTAPCGDVCSSNGGPATPAPTTPATTDDCSSTNTTASVKACINNDPIIKDLQIIVNIMSALVAIVVIGAIILGGIQYAAAGSSPDGVAKAKKRITDAVLAFIVFLFIFAFVQWLVPGGVFG